MDYDKITKPIAVVTAFMGAVGGGYTLIDKSGIAKKDILKWDPNYFEISDGPANQPFKVIVARQKIRDDCTVEDFALEVKDSNYIVHKATSSIAKFSGPANKNVEKFGYNMTIEKPNTVATGKAKLLARITYKCPEGNVVIAYPDHENLNFNIEGKKNVRDR